jgi:hypothetical protein
MHESAVGSEQVPTNPLEWLENHREAVSIALGEPKTANIRGWLHDATHLLTTAARLADQPRRRWHARGRMPMRLRLLLRPTDAVRRALDEMFGEGCPLWRAADFMRRLWRRTRNFVRHNAQPYVNRFFRHGRSPRRRHCGCAYA